MKAFLKIKQYNPSYEFSTWLFTIARNTFYDNNKSEAFLFVDISEIEATFIYDTYEFHEIEQEKEDFDSSIAQRLDLIENWLYYSSIEGTWMYYSFKDSLIYRVDLSNYKVRKDNNTGDLYFYWCEDYDKDNMVDEFIDLKESPTMNWQKEIRRSRRPKIEIVPIKQ